MMRGREFFTLAFGSIVGVGWMVVINDWLRRGGPGGAILAYLAGGLLLVPVALVYGRLALRMPESASEIAYTAAVFPPAVSFATGWTLTFAYLIVCPYEAVAIGELVAFVAPQIDTLELYRVGDDPVYLPHLLLGIVTTIAITFLNFRGIGFSATFQNLATFGLLAVFAVFATLGAWRGSLANLPPLFQHGTGFDGAFRSVLAVLPVVPYYLMGFETIPKCAEEASADFDPRRFGRIMLLALAVGTFFYVAVLAVVALLHPWQELQDTKFATLIAFREAFGWPWLVQLMMAGAVLSLFKVFNGNFLTTTRLLYAMGRRAQLSGVLGTVDDERQTPTAAILLVGGATLLASFLGRSVLVPISEVGSLAISLGWLATCLAYCRGAGGLTPNLALGLVGAAVSLALAVVVVVNSFDWPQWTVVGLWAALGLALNIKREKGPPPNLPGSRPRPDCI
jgi:amino acid transporter